MSTIKAILASQRPLYHITSESYVLDAVKHMVENNVGALPVLEENRLVGIFSERDLMRHVIVRELDPKAVKVADVMSTTLITADINDDHTTCLQKMNQGKCRHLPVVDNDKLVAFLSARDLMMAEVEGKDQEIESLTHFIHYVPPKTGQ